MSSSELLRDRHLRVTAARVAALEVLGERSHLTTEQIAVAVRERIGTISMQAAYHLLDSLAAAGLLRRVALAGSPVRYERRVGDNHHHLVCRACGEVSDVDCGSDERPCVSPPSKQGYQIDEAEVTFWGICPQCLESREVNTPT